MKKLLILMLVLGMTSASYGLYGDLRDNFELSLSGTTLTVVGLVDGSGTLNMEVGVYDETVPIMSYTTPIVVSPGAAGNAGGELASLLLYSGAGYDGFDFGVGNPGGTDAVEIGDWFTVQYSGSVGDMMNIYDNLAGVVLVGQMSIVPEPMTIALLGLGSLFLLRRRK